LINSGETGTNRWNQLFFSLCERDDRGYGNLLFAGKLIFQIRNLLIHGVPFDEQPDSECEIAVVNFENGIAVILDANSLEKCFRLVASVVVAIIRHENFGVDDELEHLCRIASGSNLNNG